MFFFLVHGGALVLSLWEHLCPKYSVTSSQTTLNIPEEQNLTYTLAEASNFL
jgi:hypothetical protein